MSDRLSIPTAQMPQPAVVAPVQSVSPNPVTQPKVEAGGAESSKYLPRALMVTNAILVLLLAFQMFHQPKYAYMTVSPSDYTFQEEMNKYGAQGWKTESCRRATSSSDDTASYECVMSRSRLGW